MGPTILCWNVRRFAASKFRGEKDFSAEIRGKITAADVVIILEAPASKEDAEWSATRLTGIAGPTWKGVAQAVDASGREKEHALILWNDSVVKVGPPQTLGTTAGRAPFSFVAKWKAGWLHIAAWHAPTDKDEAWAAWHVAPEGYGHRTDIDLFLGDFNTHMSGVRGKPLQLVGEFPTLNESGDRTKNLFDRVFARDGLIVNAVDRGADIRMSDHLPVLVEVTETCLRSEGEPKGGTTVTTNQTMPKPGHGYGTRSKGSPGTGMEEESKTP